MRTIEVRFALVVMTVVAVMVVVMMMVMVVVAAAAAAATVQMVVVWTVSWPQLCGSVVRALRVTIPCPLPPPRPPSFSRTTRLFSCTTRSLSFSCPLLSPLSFSLYHLFLSLSFSFPHLSVKLSRPRSCVHSTADFPVPERPFRAGLPIWQPATRFTFLYRTPAKKGAPRTVGILRS